MRLGLYIETNTWRVRETGRLREWESSFRVDRMKAWRLIYKATDRQLKNKDVVVSALEWQRAKRFWRMSLDKATRNVQVWQRKRHREKTMTCVLSWKPCNQPNSPWPVFTSFSCASVYSTRKWHKWMLGNPLFPKPWSIHSYHTLPGWETQTNKNCRW